MNATQIIELIVGPAVIAAIISGVISLLGAKKDRDLKYITSERKKWRVEIRKLIDALPGADWEETLKILTSLKMRINAFGINGKDYAKDAHIWELIFKIEAEKVDKDRLLLYQRQLTEYMSVLLKMDWERAKGEVRGNIVRITQWICVLVASIGLGIIVGYGFFIENSNIDVSPFIIGVLAIIGMSIIVFPYFSVTNSIFSSFLTLTTKMIKEKYGIANVVLACIFSGVFFCGAIYAVCYLIIQLKGELQETPVEGFVVVLIMYIVGLLLHLIEQFAVGEKVYKYNKTIVEIKEKYEIVSSKKAEVYVVSLKRENEESEEIRMICRVEKRKEAEE